MLPVFLPKKKKNMRNFCSAKVPHIFFSKKMEPLHFIFTRRLNNSLTSDFVKLMCFGKIGFVSDFKAFRLWNTVNFFQKCVTALNATWHPEHFFCAQCGRPFGDDGFHERDGKAFCRADYFEMFAPKCGGCARAIVDNYISALNRHWHPECFACWVSMNFHTATAVGHFNPIALKTAKHSIEFWLF